MRALRLELRGFTSFRETTILDFEGRRLFVVTGPTGAGKSSLLDAMTWALYGQVPRVGRETRQLITHGARTMAVQFDFSVRGQRYRVSRQAPGSLGARLERLRGDDVWEPLEDRARSVTQHVEELIGLDFTTFTKTVLLPQGAFDDFLRGEVRDRRAILTGLLGLERYEEAGRAARTRAAGHRAAAEALRAQSDRLDAPSPEAIAMLEREHDALRKRAETLAERTDLLLALAEEARASTEAESDAERAATTSEEAANDTAAARDTLAVAEQRRKSARSEDTRLKSERTSLGYDEAEHRRLTLQVQLLDQREAARRTLRAAEEEQRAAVKNSGQEVKAAAQLLSELEVADASREQADEAQCSALNALGLATAASLATEQELRERAGAANTARVVAERAAADCDEVVQRLAAFQEQLLHQQRVLTTTGRERDTALAERKAAGLASDAAAEGLRIAESELKARQDALDAAKRQNAALALQRGLQVGDPCPVCGEPVGHVTVHRAPELDAAADAANAAEAVANEARGAQAEADKRLAASAATEAQVVANLGRANADLAAIRTETVRVGFDADALPEAIGRISVAADAERTRVKEADGERTDAVEAARELGLLRASMGAALDDLDDLDVAPGELGEPDAVRKALDTAIKEYRRASADAQEARDRARSANERSNKAASDVEHADERQASAVSELTRAREHLASLGAEDIDADILRGAHEAAEQQALRLHELEDELASAAQELAGAHGHVEAAEGALERAEAAEKRRVAEAGAARDVADAARGKFRQAWTEAGMESIPKTGLVPQLDEDHRAELSECERKRDLAEQKVERAHQDAERAKGMREEAELNEESAQLAETLALELQSNRFIAYVQREAMHLLAANAGERLLTLSSGRYRLVVRDETFWVVDRLNGDEQRSVKTLSGGETFLASLALALALSERLPEIAGHGGAMSLESLFLDEGFGALDRDSLDAAVDGLETLSGGQRLVGIISHIPEVAERLTDRVEVVKNGATSTIRDLPYTTLAAQPR